MTPAAASRSRQAAWRARRHRGEPAPGIGVGLAGGIAGTALLWLLLRKLQLGEVLGTTAQLASVVAPYTGGEILFAPQLTRYEVGRRYSDGARICTQAASDAIPPGGDLLFLVRADGRLDPVTQVGPPEPQAGDTMVLLGPPAGRFAVTLLFGLAVRASGKTPVPFLHGVRPVADLINTPNAFSVIVAVLAGVVGVVSLTESRANALIGVFISVTTIPAAASVGLSIAYSSWGEARGSMVQLLLNVILLIVVGAAGLSSQRAIWRRRSS